jgi:hypothetical protein
MLILPGNRVIVEPAPVIGVDLPVGEDVDDHFLWCAEYITSDDGM